MAHHLTQTKVIELEIEQLGRKRLYFTKRVV